jgi:hypothetical protein
LNTRGLERTWGKSAGVGKFGLNNLAKGLVVEKFIEEEGVAGQSSTLLEWETPVFEIMAINETIFGPGVGSDGGGGDDNIGS